MCKLLQYYPLSLNQLTAVRIETDIGWQQVVCEWELSKTKPFKMEGNTVKMNEQEARNYFM